MRVFDRLALLDAFLIAGTVANRVGIRNLYFLVASSLILISILGYVYRIGWWRRPHLANDHSSVDSDKQRQRTE